MLRQWGLCMLVRAVTRYCKIQLTHGNNVSNHGVAECEISRDRNEDIDTRGRANACANDTHHAGRLVVLDLVHNGEHLEVVS